MAETFVVRDEFTVEHSSINIIQNNEAKLDRFFNVKVIYLSRNGGKVKNNFEWLRLEGDEDNRQNAKEYIIALTKPSESKVLPFPVEMYDFGDQEYLECIEKQTRAHIEQTGSGSVKIHGNSLSVTLALSILEDKINNFINRKKTLGDITKHHVEESSAVSFRSPLGKAANSSFIYSDKRHTESDLRTCMLNKTDEHHAYYSSANYGSVEKMESNHFLAQMDLEKNDTPDNDDLRYIVIDGSNIAMAHGNGKFSCKGIQIAVNYFVQRGHNVMVFVPQHKLCAPGPNNIILDQEILYQLKEKGHLAFTPSRKLQGKLINCYDDRFILSLAEREDGIIVSNDQYRDLMQEKASWKEIVEKRLLMYTFVKDNFMLPEDPLGRDGPMLDEFLRKSPKDGNCTPKKRFA
ncbi:ZC3H12 [Acanthosepion pharaonis]|uniref:ZC3H12 n=1 Tax=Acanthosepion pharaonis TaxID=158019 RepID=A0A812C4S4_ACAPH|nr:ZC3H12 [Sepia pharaonis]